MKVCIIAVCYNAHDDARRLLESIELAFSNVSSPINLTVVLSDNSTLNAPDSLINANFIFDYCYIKNDNIGYFPAFNSGMKKSDNDYKDFDYIAVSNVDLQLDVTFFNKLQQYQLTKNVGVIAPQIRSMGNDRDLNPKMLTRPSIKKIKFARFLFTYPFLFNFYNSLSRLKEHIVSKKQKAYRQAYTVAQDKYTEMYGAHGSFMIFTKNYFLLGASVDYPRFLFGEEGFVAEQARKYSLKIIHLPQVIIHDQEHGTTGQQPSAFMCSEHVKSYDYYLNTFRREHL